MRGNAVDYGISAPSQRNQAAILRHPAGACDCHAHIFGPATCFGVVEGASSTPPGASQSDYLRMLAALGIERMAIVQPSVYGWVPDANGRRAILVDNPARLYGFPSKG